MAMPTRSHGKKRIDKPAAKQPRKKDATVKQDLVMLSSKHIWIPKSIINPSFDAHRHIACGEADVVTERVYDGFLLLRFFKI